jgi:hypothetical protein
MKDDMSTVPGTFWYQKRFARHKLKKFKTSLRELKSTLHTGPAPSYCSTNLGGVNLLKDSTVPKDEVLRHLGIAHAAATPKKADLRPPLQVSISDFKNGAEIS